jgi:hypothetical protein
MFTLGFPSLFVSELDMVLFSVDRCSKSKSYEGVTTAIMHSLHLKFRLDIQKIPGASNGTVPWNTAFWKPRSSQDVPTSSNFMLASTVLALGLLVSFDQAAGDGCGIITHLWAF